jgi:NAD(P)H-hydrate epimerase
MDLPASLYSVAQARTLDRLAIERGIPGGELMERAGRAALAVLRTRYPRARRIAVVCGPGNNGGDGYVLARLAQEAGLEAAVLSLGGRPKGEAAAARARGEVAGITVREFSAEPLKQADVVVDALLGIGLKREVTGAWRDAVIVVNESLRPVLSLDIPSGLHADTGCVLGVAVRAQATVCFIGLKAGLFTGAGREYGGEIYFHDLAVPPDIYDSVPMCARRLTENALRGILPRRARDSHKGAAGHVLAIGGGPGMPGAARLAGEAAYRAGAGLVTLATHPDHAPAVNAARPELLAYGVKSPKDLKPLLARATVVALGPGLGQKAWAGALFRAALAGRRPLVIDADGLNLLTKVRRRGDWVLTPHPGEAARLLNTSTAEIQNDRFRAARAIVARYGGVCVLKGSGTLIAGPGDEPIELCDRGNPGMASGGVGDVLTGVIAALRAQGLGPRAAARLGVWVHACAGDAAAAAGGEIGLLAGDLMAPLRAEFNRLAT